MRQMGMTWGKWLDIDGTAYNLIGYATAYGIMSVVRLMQERPNPHCHMSDKHRAVLPQLVAQGAYYYELNNEPNLSTEWQQGQWPTSWPDAVFDEQVASWVPDAEYVVGCGGFPAIPAMSPGGEYKRRPQDQEGDDIDYLRRWCRALKRRGVPAWMGTRAWIAVHNAALNHPLDYPDDAVNQARHPGQRIDTWYYSDGSPTGASNCLRKYEAVHQIVLEELGLDLPVICTEGGVWPYNASDPGYPALTEDEASLRQANALRAMETAPEYLLAQCPWLLGNRELAGLDGAFEADAWIRKAGWGNCPADAPPVRTVMDMLMADPCKVRRVTVTQAEVDADLAARMQAHIVPLVPGNAFARAALARKLAVRSDEVYEEGLDGHVYLCQMWYAPDDPTTQWMIRARVTDTSGWWSAYEWVKRAN
jgi:hypothetical protein